MKRNNKQPTHRETLQKINQIDTRLQKLEKELKHIELSWKKKSDTIEKLKVELNTYIEILVPSSQTNKEN
jgi:xylose isomerase